MPIFNIGSAPNDHTGDPERTAWQKQNRLPNPDSTINADSGDYTGTTEQKLTAAVADAKAKGKKYVFMPQSFVPFNSTLVTFDPAVQMLREGGDPSAYDVLAYGAAGDGVTDDTAAINTAETMRPAGRTLSFAGKNFVVGSSYSGGTGAGNANKFLRMVSAGNWDLRNASIKYNGAAAFVGSDGGTYGVINVLADNSRIEGDGAFTIDCNNLAAVAVAYKSQTSGHDFYLRIVNKTEVANSNWPGISGSCSADITGVAISGRAKNIAGILKRPNCPMISATGGAITTHSDVTAYVLGGSFQLGNMTGCAITMNDTFDVCMQRLDTLGILRFPQKNARNDDLWDIVCNDVGCSNIELYGAMGVSPARPAWGSSITVDVQTAQDLIITATSNIAATCAAPSNLPNSSDRTWRIRLIFYNNSGGALTTPIAFATGAGAYKANGPVLPPNGTRIVVEFTYDQVANLWIETARTGTNSPVQFAVGNLNTTATSESSIVSFTLPTGLLTQDGQCLRITYAGRAVTQNCTTKLNVNATNAGTMTVTAGETFVQTAWITRVDASNARFTTQLQHGSTVLMQTNTSGITWASAAVPVDFRGSAVSGGTLQLDTGTIEFLAAPGV